MKRSSSTIPWQRTTKLYWAWQLLSIVAAILLFAVVFYKAWFTDETFLYFRYLDNLTLNHGLRWNAFERAQGFQSPMWLGIQYFLMNFSSNLILNSLIGNLVGVVLFLLSLFYWEKNPRLRFTLLLAFGASRTFVEYATAGLPYSWIFFFSLNFYYLWRDKFYAWSAFMGLTTTLFALLNIQYVIWLLPFWLMLILNQAFKLKVIWGLLPLLAWFAFCGFYFGSFWPNPLLADWHSGLPLFERATDFGRIYRGLSYFLVAGNYDPVMGILGFFIFVIYLLQGTFKIVFQRHHLHFLFGITFYLCFLLLSGGSSYMGRGFIPIVIWLPLLFLDLLAKVSEKYWIVFFALLVLFIDRNAVKESFFIRDEYAVMSPTHSYQKILETKKLSLMQNKEINFFTNAYYAGPEAKIIDAAGNMDPFIARLPAKHFSFYRGFLQREVPPGYIPTITTGQNYLESERLHQYYDALKQITQDDLYSEKRLVVLSKFLKGEYEYLLYDYKVPEATQLQKMEFYGKYFSLIPEKFKNLPFFDGQ